MSVPLHLLQNRVHSAYNPHNASTIAASGAVFSVPEPFEAITTENLTSQIKIVQDFFASRLAASNGRPLIDDEDLPPKQRFPKPRLGPTGKISSPRKRPLREQQQAAKKKRKLEELGKAEERINPMKPLKLDMPVKSADKDSSKGGDPEKGEKEKGMISPESLTAA